MPKLRPHVCQKSAVLGPAREFQDAIWKCFKCQRNVTPLSSVFISFSPVPLFPWYLYSLHASSLGQSLQHRDPRLPREGPAVHTTAAFAEHLFLLPPLGLPDLFPLCLRGPHPAFPPPSCPAMTLSTPCPRCQLCTWICHTLSGQGHWSHGQSWALHLGFS